MMLESARSASLGGGLFDGGETEQYLALMDRQVALELARHGGFGFGKMLEQQLGSRDAARADAASPAASRPARGRLAPRHAGCRGIGRARRCGVSAAVCRRASARSVVGRRPRPRRADAGRVRVRVVARSQGRGRGARHRAAPAACASRARDGLGPRDAAARRRAGAQPVRHQGRRIVVRRGRGALDPRARGWRDGAAARAVQSLRQHRRELRGLRELALHGAALRRCADAGRRPGGLRARRDEGGLRDRPRGTRTSGSRSITAIVSSMRCAASICRLRLPEQPI